MSDLSEKALQNRKSQTPWNAISALLQKSPPAPTAPTAHRSQLLLFALLLFVGSLFLFTRANSFPFYYHPDESSKVEQIQTKDWKFSHPMLMLNTAHRVAEATGTLEDSQRVGELGRSVSAFFCAAAVSLLAATLWLSVGRFAGIAAGLLLLTNHQLFELSHYLKEDTSLLFGLGLWFLGFALYWKRPSVGNAILVGAGAAAALSGKYLGAFTLLLALGMIPYRAEKGSKLKLTLTCVVSALVVIGLINHSLFAQFEDFRASFSREVDLASKGHRGLTRDIPHVVYFTAFKDNLFYTLWVPIAWFYFAVCWMRRKQLNGFEWLVALFPVAFLLVLSFFPKTNDRYFLPATALFLCTAAWGLHHFATTFKIPRGITALLLTLLVAVQTVDLAKYYRAFEKDDLADLTHWLNDNLPNATLAIDGRVMLPSPRKTEFAAYQIPLKAKVVKQTVDRFESLEELKAAGVTHVVLSESTYGRYRQKSLRPKDDAKETFKKRSDLYRAILENREPIWGADRPRSTVIYLHPGLQVYALSEN